MSREILSYSPASRPKSRLACFAIAVLVWLFGSLAGSLCTAFDLDVRFRGTTNRPDELGQWTMVAVILSLAVSLIALLIGAATLPHRQRFYLYGFASISGAIAQPLGVGAFYLIN